MRCWSSNESLAESPCSILWVSKGFKNKAGRSLLKLLSNSKEKAEGILEPGLATPAYGNEPSAACMYSAAAIVIDVPAFSKWMPNEPAGMLSSPSHSSEPTSVDAGRKRSRFVDTDAL